MNVIYSRIAMLLAAINDTISPNYRRISLRYVDGYSDIQIILEYDNTVDRQYIFESNEDYVDFTANEGSSVKVIISDAPALDDLDSSWSVVYNRRDKTKNDVFSLNDCANVPINFSSHALITEQSNIKDRHGEIILPSSVVIERNRRIYLLNKALSDTISPNFRTISFGWKDSHNKVRFLFECKDDADIYFAKIASRKFFELLNNNKESIDVEFHFDSERFMPNIDSMGLYWFTMYSKRIYFEDRFCKWVSLDSFDDMTGFRRHQEWIIDKIRLGSVSEADVTAPLFSSSTVNEKWYRNKFGEVWRLIEPFGSYPGVFERVL